MARHTAKSHKIRKVEILVIQIEILLNKKGEIEFVFRDKYNKRNEVISIILEDLEEFLSQQCLYSGIPKKTLIFRVQQR